MQITVVGAGVVGLMTARVLEEHGHTVQVVADGPHEATTSAIAGAVWFPYRAGPPARVAAWAARTREWLEPFAADREAGIDMLAGYEITTETGLDVAAMPRPWWAGTIPIGRAAAPVTGAPPAWTFGAPRMEPSRFMPWLAGQLARPIERRVVTALAAERGNFVINCTGLHARQLAADPELVPLLGQVVIADHGSVDPGITVTDHRDPDEIFYVIPRRTELVLGGCSIPLPDWAPGTPVPPDDPAITARILDHADRLGLRIGAVRGVRVGLRPYRLHVRLERDPTDARVIHNYGHGGAGYTLSRGCAEEVAALVAPVSG